MFIHGVYSIITCQSALKKIRESTRGKGEREEKGRENCLPKNSQVQSYTRLLKYKCPSGIDLDCVLCKREVKPPEEKKSHKKLQGVRGRPSAESWKNINIEETGREKCQ